MSFKSVAEKIEDLNKTVKGDRESNARFTVAISRKFKTQDDRLEVHELMLSAVREILGAEVVDKMIETIQVRTARANAAKEKELLDEGIADGYITPTDVIGLRSIFVCKPLDADGNTMEPGRAQFSGPTLQSPYKERLVGQKVGFRTEVGGVTFEVIEIYEVDEAAAAKAIAGKQAAMKAAVEASASAPAPDAGPTAEVPQDQFEPQDTQDQVEAQE